MAKFIGILLSLLMVAFWTPVTAPAEDLENNQPPGKVPAAIVDLMVARPLLAVGALIPTSAFVATLPITYTFHRDLQCSQVLVHHPWTYVADRPLGIFAPGKSVAVRIDDKLSEQYRDYFIQAGADRSPLRIK